MRWSGAEGAAASLALLVMACGPSHHESTLSRIEKTPVAETAAAGRIEIDALSQDRVRAIDSIVVNWENVPPFAVQTRRGALEHYPCVSCHKGVEPPLKADMRRAGVPPGQKFAHGKIELKHAPDAVMTCGTCHDKRDQSRLLTTTGEIRTLDRGFELCRSCHFRQFADWAGGAHGKRLTNWAGPRIVVSCVHCHNPHAPAIGSRWPVAYPRIDRRQAP